MIGRASENFSTLKFDEIFGTDLCFNKLQLNFKKIH